MTTSAIDCSFIFIYHRCDRPGTRQGSFDELALCWVENDSDERDDTILLKVMKSISTVPVTVVQCLK